MIINVRNFGASGNGIHDDSSAIQAAILEAHKTGGDIFIPAGQYLLSTANYGNKQDGGKTAAALHVFSNMKLFGEKGTVLMAGCGITHILINDNGDNDADNFGVSGYDGGENICLESIVFDGGALRGNLKCTPINFSHAKNISLRDLTVINTSGGWHCIEINSSMNVEISGCLLGTGCDCSELIQLDAATNEGNLGLNDMTTDRYIRIFHNFFDCDRCRGIGNHGDVNLFDGRQNWAEYISIYENVFEGSPDPVEENISARHRPGFINFVYHTRFLSIYNNTFHRTVKDEKSRSIPFNAVYVCRSCRHAEEKIHDKTVCVYNNILNGMDSATDCDSFYTVYNNLVVKTE